jgi:Ca2+/Na+ antiporter
VSEDRSTVTSESTSNANRIWLTAMLVSVSSMFMFHFLGSGWGLAFLAAEIALISIVIAQACDPFADAAQFIGETLKVPGSVRGATLDAVASSMPELFCGIFFVVTALSSAGTDEQAAILAGSEGYGATIATCAGSAVYNMILIPAFCAIVISYFRKDRPSIVVDDEVISRDGMWCVSCQILMVLFLFQDHMYWWMACIFMILYAVYVCQLYRDAQLWRRRMLAVKEIFATQETSCEVGAVTEQIRSSGLKVSYNFVARALEQLKTGNDNTDEEDDTDSAGVLFGFFNVRLTSISAWVVIGVSSVVAAVACYFLVNATREIAIELSVPTFFVAVIVAAAASSVPDTLLAIGAAMRGDDSGAVSNAFGSNIFDVCICLSIPLLVNSYLTGWNPVSLLQDGKPLPGLVGLRTLLVVLTVITLAIMWHNRELTRKKAFVLCGLYAVFICYAVLGSMGIDFGT